MVVSKLNVADIESMPSIFVIEPLFGINSEKTNYVKIINTSSIDKKYNIGLGCTETNTIIERCEYSDVSIIVNNEELLIMLIGEKGNKFLKL